MDELDWSDEINIHHLLVISYGCLMEIFRAHYTRIIDKYIDILVLL